jgi:LacI family transcriptional regulator
MKGFTTTREIAAKVGCSHVTVSRALKDHPNVNAALREKIKRAAREMGYRPNPLVASLMTGNAMKRPGSSTACTLGWLNTYPNARIWRKYPYRKIYLDGARERAEELGYALDEIWAAEPGMSGKRLQGILTSRGIYGLIIPSSLFALGEMDIDWDLFSVACIGHQTTDQFHWHRVSLAVRDSMQSCINHLLSLGYSRIGLAITDRPIYFDPVSIRSIFTYNRVLKPKRFIARELVYNRTEEGFLDEVKGWIGKSRPDVIICCDNAIMDACHQLGLKVPDDIGLAHLHLADDVKSWAGIDPFEKRQASAAVDLLSSHLQRNERGIPQYAKMVQILGEWRNGSTVRS